MKLGLLLHSQATLYFVLHCLGVSVCLAFGPRARVHLCCALGFATGLATVVVLELLMLTLGVPFTAGTIALAIAAATAACLVVLRRRGWPGGRAWSIVALWTVGFGLVAYVLTRERYVVLTWDSHYIVGLANVLARHGGFVPGLVEKLGSFGVFTILAQSLVVVTPYPCLFNLATVLAVSGAALFAVTLGVALDVLGVRQRWRYLLIGLLTLAVLTIAMLARHAFYIHTGLGTAIYLFIFCSLYWIGEVDNDLSVVPIAFLGLLALALHRIEGPIICILFLSLTVLRSRLAPRVLLTGLGGFTLVQSTWLLVLAQHLRADSLFLTPRRCYVLVALLLGFFAYAAASMSPRGERLRRLSARIPLLTVVVCGGLLIAAFLVRPVHMAQSTAAWAESLWQGPYWEGTWQAVAALALLGLLVPAAPAREAFVVGVPVYAGIVLLLVWGRTPYYVGAHDSAARMAIHFVPLVFFYFGLKFIPLFARREVTAP